MTNEGKMKDEDTVTYMEVTWQMSASQWNREGLVTPGWKCEMVAHALRAAVANRCNAFCRHWSSGLVVDVEQHVTDQDLLT